MASDAMMPDEDYNPPPKEPDLDVPLYDEFDGDYIGDAYYEELENALDECGLGENADGSCSLIGTEHCGFWCPFNVDGAACASDDSQSSAASVADVGNAPVDMDDIPF